MFCAQFKGGKLRGHDLPKSSGTSESFCRSKGGRVK